MFFKEYNDKELSNQNNDNKNCTINPTLHHSFNLDNKNAIILAAGLGMRMVPINSEISKGLLVVNNQTLIENIILKLKENNINDIYIVVGYMKEQYEWLIDKYNVHLIINNKYKETNNCYSLYLARDYLNNSYIIPCDIYLGENIFNEYKCSSWYLFNGIREVITNYRITK
ncbi:NTP transferase domain-containing protein, partial [Thomasclavelia cocleata]